LNLMKSIVQFEICQKSQNTISVNNINYYTDVFRLLLNRKVFLLEDLLALDRLSEYEESFHEILPGIDLRIICDNKVKKWYKILKNLNASISLELRVRNKRDRISIRYDDMYIKFEFSNSEHERERSFEGTSPTRASYVNVQQIKKYPSLLTGDARKCAVWRWFGSHKLIDVWADYSPFTVREMLTLTSERQEFLELCRKSEHCGSLLRKFETNTYKEDVPDYDQIQLANCNGELEAEEGKHRTCIVKRFKIPKVYALVYDVIEKETGRVEDPFTFASRTNKQAAHVLQEYYESFYRIGLNKEQITYAVENGLRGAELFDHINKCQKFEV